jgi:DNA polymerase-1
MDSRLIAVDTETNGLRPFEGHRIAGFSTYCDMPGMNGYSMSFYFPFRHKPGESLFDVSDNIPLEWLRELKPAFERPETELIFQNQKFDCHMFAMDDVWIIESKDAARAVGKPVGEIYDIATMDHYADEESDHDLDSIGQRHLGMGKVEILKHNGKPVPKSEYWKLAPAAIESYACRDAEITYKAFPVLKALLESYRLWDVWLRDEPELTRLLYYMEREGIAVDRDLAAQLSKDTQRQMRVLEDDMGFDPGKRNELARRLFLSPPTGLGLTPPSEVTKDRTSDFPSGIPVLDEETLNLYEGTPLVDLVLEYRGLVKANSTWYDGWTVKSQYDGRLHSTFNQIGTRTSRQSSSHPNLHQMPRNVDDFPARRMLMPDPGYWMVEFDYDQIEARIACIYARAEKMQQMFIEKVDVHQANGDLLGTSRQTAKHGLYTVLYGGQVTTLADTLSRLEWQTTKRRLPPEAFMDQAQNFFDQFYSEYPGFKKVSKDAEQMMKGRGYVNYWNGRQRRIQKRFCRRHGVIDHCLARKAFNSICQGGAAQIINESMRLIHRQQDFKFYRMLLQVHDSLWFLVRADEMPQSLVDGIFEEITETMEWPHRTGKFPVPFTVSGKVINYGTAKTLEAA